MIGADGGIFVFVRVFLFFSDVLLSMNLTVASVRSSACLVWCGEMYDTVIFGVAYTEVGQVSD
jgi:hypothetical protein